MSTLRHNFNEIAPPKQAKAAPPPFSLRLTLEERQRLEAEAGDMPLDVSQRQREAHVHHDRPADDLRAAVEIPEGAAFRHGRRRRGRPDRLIQNPSDKTTTLDSQDESFT
jgi:hypothetical protein